MADYSFCSQCGAPTHGQGAFCTNCGQRVAGVTAPPGSASYAGAVWPEQPPVTRAKVPGDWVGALLAVAAGVLAMVVLPLVLLLVAGAQHVSADSIPALTAMLVALSVGGSVDVGFAATSSTFAFMPLMVSIIGYTTVAFIFGMRLRRVSDIILRDAVLQAVRVLGMFGLALLAISAVGRLKLRSDASLVGTLIASAGVSANVSLLRTVFVGLVLLGLTLAATVAVAFPHIMPAELASWYRRVQGAVEGVVVAGVFISGVAVALFLVELFIHRDAGIGQAAFGSFASLPVSLSIMLVLIFLLNIALIAIAATLGAPLGFYGPNGAGNSGSYLTYLSTDRQSWAVGALGLAAVVLGGAFAARRSTSRRQAIRTGWVMGPVLAVALIAVALLTDASATLAGGSKFGFNFNYWVAPLLGLAWGAVGGTVGAVCTMPLSSWRASSGGLTAAQPASQRERNVGGATAVLVFVACVGVALWGLIPQGVETATAAKTSTSQASPSRTET